MAHRRQLGHAEALQQILELQSLYNGRGQLLAERGGAAQDGVHRAEVELVYQRVPGKRRKKPSVKENGGEVCHVGTISKAMSVTVLGQEQHDRGHDVQNGDLLLLNGLQEQGRVELGHHIRLHNIIMA
jgi:hypothetical protein